jgi:hypothetical protein
MSAERLELDVVIDGDAAPGRALEPLARLLISLSKKETAGRAARRQKGRFEGHDSSAPAEQSHYGARGR